MREPGDTTQGTVIAATDPANPYGTTLKWFTGTSSEDASTSGDSGRGPTRTVGALVVLVDGYPAAYLRRGERELLLMVPEAEPQRSSYTRAAARALMNRAKSREEGQRGMLISEINGAPASTHASAPLFVAEGFTTTAMGLQARILPQRSLDGVPEVEFLPKAKTQQPAR